MDSRWIMTADKIVLCLMYDTEKITLDIMKEWDFENRIENGVEYHLVINYADRKDRPEKESS